MTPQAWHLQLALGACHAGRLLAAASLACALFALAQLADPPATTSAIARSFWTLAALAVLLALYLAVRLELDRGLFQRLAAHPHTQDDDLAALDRAMVELGWKVEDGAPRPLADRVTGVLSLAKRLGGVVAVQVAAMLGAALMP